MTDKELEEKISSLKKELETLQADSESIFEILKDNGGEETHDGYKKRMAVLDAIVETKGALEDCETKLESISAAKE